MTDSPRKARKCEVPGCGREALVKTTHRSGDKVWICGQPHVYPEATELRVVDSPRWTPEQVAAIEDDPVLRLLKTEGLDALLTPEERDALREHLDYLARLRRRVEAESRQEPMA